MTGKVYNVLFLCTGNSARSILAEALLNRDGRGRFRAYSAGSYPKGQVHPMAIELLQSLDFPTEGLRSKSWNEFTGPDAPVFDFIFTVCDNAAGETCPIWPGHPMTAHWGIEDPAAVEGEEQRDAFRRALQYLHNRIALFLNLPIEGIDRLATQRKLKDIGHTEGATNNAEGNGDR
ncbi:MAG: arsenate reductase ArsC [Sphingomonas sp.]|nr:arsenate reductase ArsC [Sphingomonas sp.]